MEKNTMSVAKKPANFQQVLKNLRAFWQKNSCLLLNSYNTEVGAGTFNPATFFGSLGSKSFRAAYVEPCSRPADGRYGDNPHRMQQYFQFQVVLKPSPDDCQNLYVKSLEYLGVDLSKNDLRFVKDDWRSPTLGANGVGWEVRFNGMEITQFTYFQKMGGLKVSPTTVEITYGLERICMIVHKKKNVYELDYGADVKYADLFRESERQFCHYNFSMWDRERLERYFGEYEQQAKECFKEELYYPGYHCTVKCSHLFNLLDAGRFISVHARTGYIKRIRKMATIAAEIYVRAEQNKIANEKTHGF